MANTNIEWSQKVWNPVRGCTRVSSGCKNCYAERQAIRQSGPGGAYEGLVKSIATVHDGKKFNEPRWTGKVVTDREKLHEPMGWRKPSRVFVNSMSDLFHERVGFRFIDRIFGIMAMTPRHSYQILTKRPERMLEYFASINPSDTKRQLELLELIGWHDSQDPDLLALYRIKDGLENVWLGVSVEDQKAADERIPILLKTPAAVRWISAEPLLGPINLDGDEAGDLHALGCGETNCTCGNKGIDWAVVGGESGPRARPCNIDWVRAIARQCEEAGVPVFVKQLGAVPMEPDEVWRGRVTTRILSASNRMRVPDGYVPLKFSDRKGGNIEEFPADLRVRQYPEATGVR